MEYEITKSFIFDHQHCDVGLYRVSDVWHVDTPYFGAMPVDACQGALGDILRNIIKKAAA